MPLFYSSIRIQLSRRFLLKIRIYFYFALAICLMGIKTEVRADDHYEVVTNIEVPEKALSINSLRSIFSMHLKTWPNGTKIRVFVFPDDDRLHKSFSKEKLKVFPY